MNPALAPLTETITIGADPLGVKPGLVAHGWNGARRVLLAAARDGDAPVLTRDGANLRECYGGALDPRDVLDLLAAGRCGDFPVDRRRQPMTARRDADFA